MNVVDEGLLGLGEASGPPYAVEAVVQQVRWGGCGLVFGYRECRWKGVPCKQYHLVRLVARPAPAKEPFGLERVIVRWYSERASNSATLDFVPIPAPGAREHRLRVAVGKDGLAGVFWDGKKLSGLSTPEQNARFQPVDYQGAFGAYLARNTGVFRNARYSLSPEEIHVRPGK
jgi:hypothetical protein